MSELDRAKAASLGHLLFKSARLLNEIGVARVRRKFSLDALRPSHMQVLPHLDLEGTRATVLAQRMGITKQAVGQLLDDLEAMGMLERVPDPTDARARLVRFTEQGKAGIFEGLAVLAGVEAELVATVGAERLARMKEDLAVLLPVLEGISAKEG